MTRKEFTHIARRFSFVDHADAPFLSERDWPLFRDDPISFFLLADDDTAERLWRVVTEETENGPTE